ncbi:MAG: hypothetical protein U0694_06970 [Anaerolineae bacterium]
MQPYIVLVIGVALVAVVVLWVRSTLKQRQAMLAKMQEITEPNITAVALPKTLSDEPYVIKEGDRGKMQPGVEYAYFYGSLDPGKAQSQRYHTITIFSLEKLQKPVFKSMTDADVMGKLQAEGWQKTGSQSFGSDDVVAHYFQRHV